MPRTLVRSPSPLVAPGPLALLARRPCLWEVGRTGRADWSTGLAGWFCFADVLHLPAVPLARRGRCPPSLLACSAFALLRARRIRTQAGLCPLRLRQQTPWLQQFSSCRVSGTGPRSLSERCRPMPRLAPATLRPAPLASTPLPAAPACLSPPHTLPHLPHREA